jgi:hypothetical protein
MVRSGKTEGTKRRPVGIDLGKREYTMAIIGKGGKMGIRWGKTGAQGRQALYRLSGRGDKAALETGNLAFTKRGTFAALPLGWLYMAGEIMERVGCGVRALNSAKLPFIWDSPAKTGKAG